MGTQAAHVRMVGSVCCKYMGSNQHLLHAHADGNIVLVAMIWLCSWGGRTYVSCQFEVVEDWTTSRCQPLCNNAGVERREELSSPQVHDW